MGYFASALIGVWLGFMLALSIIYTETGLSECEGNLPRNQHCILTAVPQTNDQ